MNRIPLFLMFLIFQMSLAAFAISDHQFKQEIREHRRRVSQMARDIYDHYPEHFLGLRNLPGLTGLRLLKSYMALHDLPKTMTLDQLLVLELERTQTLFSELRNGYGLCQAPKCVGDLNQVEEKLKTIVMEKKLLELNDQEKFDVWNDLKFLETVSDVIDTKVWRGPELGFQFKKGASVEFFRSRGQQFASQIAAEFEPRAISQKQNQQLGCRQAVQ
jgi:hypothetical protein